MAAGTRHFQIELLSNGLAIIGPESAYAWRRGRRFLHMGTRCAGATSYLEADYVSSSEADVDIQLLAPNGAVLDTLTLTWTTDVSPNQAKTLRSSTPLHLIADGIYQIKTGAIVTGELDLFNCRLVVEQPNPTLTEEHKNLLMSNSASTEDASGIAGSDIFRTTSTVYAPAMNLTAGAYDEGGTEKYVFPWLKYIQTEWPGLQFAQIEIIADGFADRTSAALYFVDPVTGVQTEVPGSAMTELSSGNYLPALGPTFAMPAVDGYYALRVKSSNGAANVFLAGAFLHMVSEAQGDKIARGRTYIRVGDGESKGRRKSRPVIDGPAVLEMCTFKNHGLSINYLLQNTDNQGLGSNVTASALNLDTAYTKGVFRSAEIGDDLVEGDYYDATNNDGNGIEAWIAVNYEVEVSGCFRPSGGILYEMNSDFYDDSGCPIRRVRVTPHMAQENLMLWIEKIELLCQMGLGLDGDDQGSDPQIMVEWSDDGGQTWSSEQWLSLGKIGEYSRRAILRGQGRSRDRVYRVTYTEPTAIRIIDAFAEYKLGTGS